MPGLAPVAALPNGEAWLAGACGLRARVTPSTVVEYTAPRRKIHSDIGGMKLDCDGQASYATVAATSATVAYFAGSTRCGLDPNGIFARPIEYFDGQKFRDLPGGVLAKDARQQAPDQLRLGASQSYVLARGDDSLGLHECGVYGLSQGRLSLLRACKPPEPGGTSETFSSLGIDPAGGVWVAAHRFAADAGEGPGTPFLLHIDGLKSREEGPADSGVLTQASDRTLWLFGKKAWRLTPQGWQPSPMPIPSDAHDFAVNNDQDVWLATEQGVLHFDGTALSRVPFAPPDENASTTNITINGGHVWANDNLNVWELLRADEPVPAPFMKHYGGE